MASTKGLSAYRAFMKREKKAGKTHKQSLAAWKKHKKGKAAAKPAKKAARRLHRHTNLRKPVKHKSRSKATYFRVIKGIRAYLYDLARNQGASRIEQKSFVDKALMNVREYLSALHDAVAKSDAERAARLEAAVQERAAKHLVDIAAKAQAASKKARQKLVDEAVKRGMSLTDATKYASDAVKKVVADAAAEQAAKVAAAASRGKTEKDWATLLGLK